MPATDAVDPAALSAATYHVVDALIRNRLAIAGSKMSNAEKAVLPCALDDVGAATDTKMVSPPKSNGTLAAAHDGGFEGTC